MKREKMIRLMIALLALTVSFAPAGGFAAASRYQAVFMDLFDTVTSVIGFAANEEEFQQETGRFHDGMERYHRLYDIYHEYEGMVNLCTLNAHAGETMTVDQEIIDLLLFARDVDEFSGGRTNATLGSVLKLWHEAREEGIEHPESAAAPSEDELREALLHTGFDKIEVDAEQRTVRFTDPALSLDVGALAKGYAVQRVCETMKTGYLISVGGNVYATGPKADGSAWTIGVQNPDGGGEAYLHKLSVTSGSVVTSGDYQRYFVADGKIYHHIIDPDTLFPANRWRAVTVITPDSGLADALSTTLFLLPAEEGQALLDRFGAEAMWMSADGTIVYSPGYQKFIRK